MHFRPVLPASLALLGASLSRSQAGFRQFGACRADQNDASLVPADAHCDPIFHRLYDLNQWVQATGIHYRSGGRLYEEDGVVPRRRRINRTFSSRMMTQ